MGRPNNSFETMARKAAERLDQAREAGEQLWLLPEPGDLDQGDGKVGRSKGKVTNQMREWLASKGYRMPEEVLAQMAALATGQDPVLAAMEKTELVLAWAFDGQKTKDGGEVTPTGGQRLAAFQQLYTAQMRAAEALLPYGAPKASPDQVVNQSVQIVVPRGADPRDVTPRPRQISGRMVPADVRAENERNQALDGTDPDGSDARIRTDGAND